MIGIMHVSSRFLPFLLVSISFSETIKKAFAMEPEGSGEAARFALGSGISELNLAAVSERARELQGTLEEAAAWAGQDRVTREEALQRGVVLSNKAGILAREVRDLGRSYAAVPGRVPEGEEARVLRQLPVALSTKALPTQEEEMREAFKDAHRPIGDAAEAAVATLPSRKGSRRRRAGPPGIDAGGSKKGGKEWRSRKEALLASLRLGEGMPSQRRSLLPRSSSFPH